MLNTGKQFWQLRSKRTPLISKQSNGILISCRNNAWMTFVCLQRPKLFLRLRRTVCGDAGLPSGNINATSTSELSSPNPVTEEPKGRTSSLYLDQRRLATDATVERARSFRRRACSFCIFCVARLSICLCSRCGAREGRSGDVVRLAGCERSSHTMPSSEMIMARRHVCRFILLLEGVACRAAITRS